MDGVGGGGASAWGEKPGDDLVDPFTDGGGNTGEGVDVEFAEGGDCEVSEEGGGCEGLLSEELSGWSDSEGEEEEEEEEEEEGGDFSWEDCDDSWEGLLGVSGDCCLGGLGGGCNFSLGGLGGDLDDDGDDCGELCADGVDGIFGGGELFSGGGGEDLGGSESEVGEGDCSFEESSGGGDEFDEFELGGGDGGELSPPDTFKFAEKGLLSLPLELE